MHVNSFFVVVVVAFKQERFLLERIKINGKTGQLGNNVAVVKGKQKMTVTSDIPLSKRYFELLAYLSAFL